MPHATTDDAVKLWYEETGSGTPVIFVHEFAGDVRSWEPQLRHFGQRYRAIAFNARGYLPSDVPDDEGRYGWEFAVSDLAAVLSGLKIDRARCGWRKPKCRVANPPMDRPTTCARSIARCANTEAMSSAARFCE